MTPKEIGTNIIKNPTNKKRRVLRVILILIVSFRLLVYYIWYEIYC